MFAENPDDFLKLAVVFRKSAVESPSIIFLLQ